MTQNVRIDTTPPILANTILATGLAPKRKMIYGNKYIFSIVLKVRKTKILVGRDECTISLSKRILVSSSIVFRGIVAKLVLLVLVLLVLKSQHNIL